MRDGKTTDVLAERGVAPADNGGNGRRASDGAARKRRADYPKYTLDEALEIPKAIKEKYSGRPMPPKTLADACGTSHGNSVWRVKLAASAAYGLTEGSYSAQTVSLTQRAVSIISPRSTEEHQQAMREAALSPATMRAVYEHFSDGQPPREAFFFNVLQRDFGIPAEHCEQFEAILRANATYAYSASDSAREPEISPQDVSIQDKTDAGQPPTSPVCEVRPAGTAQGATRVFISHSRNEGILDVLRATMQLAGFQYEIAEEGETAAVPVPDKIMDAMRRCSAAVINVSADEHERRPDESFGINQNVLIEIGCAFALYGKQHSVLLWDKRVRVPSNLQGLYRCEYEGDELSAAGLLKLQLAIANFRETAAPGAL